MKRIIFLLFEVIVWQAKSLPFQKRCKIPQNTTIAPWMKKAGYDLVYGGKEHLPKPLGFKDISDNERDELATAAADYIKSKPQELYFLILSFINTHDICYMAIRDFAETDFDHLLIRKGKTKIYRLDKVLQKPEEMSDKEFFARHYPPVPPNLESQEDKPEAIKALVNIRSFRKNAREKYTDKDWRMHHYAYAHLTEIVDRHIQEVLNALKQCFFGLHWLFLAFGINDKLQIQ
jgi:arylsulfatase A-like enzyme